MEKDLHEWLHDELDDAEKYAEAAKKAEGFERQFLRDMSHEEYEHACAVWKMMEHEHMTDGMDKYKVFHETHEKVYH